MSPAFLVRLRPTSPWRTGSDSGQRERTEPIYHSDALFSAVCSAMERLGRLDAWLAAAAPATGEPAVRLSSCFPFLGDTLYFAPPRNVWPPSSSGRLRWKSARFVPRQIVERLLAGKGIEEERWTVDASSQCMLAIDRRGAAPTPFRAAVRSGAAVDRGSSGAVLAHAAGCLEFAPDAGLWFVVEFADEAAREAWGDALRSALRLLADSGFGGGRSKGWGRAEAPEITEGELPGLLLKMDAPRPVPPPKVVPVAEEVVEPEVEPAVVEEVPVPSEEVAPVVEAEVEPAPAPVAATAAAPSMAYWLLSLFSPGGGDMVDWQRGSYALVERSGRVESAAGSGAHKRSLRMVAEGSVVVATSHPVGAAPDVAPEGFPHPVYRAGFAVAIPIPWRSV